jgi:hypothetical protein
MPMSDPGLPADLAALERRLADRPRVEPSADLGPRVLAATRAALARRPAGAWRPWAAAAAAALLAVNLSMSVAADTDWDLMPAVEPGDVAATTELLRELAPDLPESELRRQALLTRAAAGLTPTAALAPNWDRFRTAKEPDRWDER